MYIYYSPSICTAGLNVNGIPAVPQKANKKTPRNYHLVQ